MRASPDPKRRICAIVRLGVLSFQNFVSNLFRVDDFCFLLPAWIDAFFKDSSLHVDRSISEKVYKRTGVLNTGMVDRQTKCEQGKSRGSSDCRDAV